MFEFVLGELNFISFFNIACKNSITQFTHIPIIGDNIHMEILHTLSMQASKQIINKEYVPGNAH